MKRSKKKQRSGESAAAVPPESGKAATAIPESEEADIFKSSGEPATVGRFSVDGVRILQTIGVVFAAAELIWLVFRISSM